MNDERARELLDAERRRVEQLLSDETEAFDEDRTTANETGDMADPAERLTAEGLDDALISGLRDRLGQIERAEAAPEGGDVRAFGGERCSDPR